MSLVALRKAGAKFEIRSATNHIRQFKEKVLRALVTRIAGVVHDHRRYQSLTTESDSQHLVVAVFKNILAFGAAARSLQPGEAASLKIHSAHYLPPTIYAGGNTDIAVVHPSTGVVHALVEVKKDDVTDRDAGQLASATMAAMDANKSSCPATNGTVAALFTDSKSYIFFSCEQKETGGSYVFERCRPLNLMRIDCDSPSGVSATSDTYDLADILLRILCPSLKSGFDVEKTLETCDTAAAQFAAIFSEELQLSKVGQSGSAEAAKILERVGQLQDQVGQLECQLKEQVGQLECQRQLKEQVSQLECQLKEQVSQLTERVGQLTERVGELKK